MKTIELTDLAETWLATNYPDSIIVRELSVGQWGCASIDIAAITKKEIVGVEVKGEFDSHRRLPLQSLAYGMVAKKMFLLPDKKNYKQCEKSKPENWGLLDVYDGICGLHRITYNHTKTVYYRRAHDTRLLSPYRLCGTLWKTELIKLAGNLSIPIKSGAKVRKITDTIVKNAPVTKIHDGMIELLRCRKWKKRVLDLRNS